MPGGRLRFLVGRERGSVLVVVAVWLIVLLLVVGLVLDCARVIMCRLWLRDVCEAAAHAGAQEADVVPHDPGPGGRVRWEIRVRPQDAEREALACLDRNLSGSMLEANRLSIVSRRVEFPSVDRVRVVVEVAGETFLLRVLGGGYGRVNFEVSGEARAVEVWSR